MLEPKDLVEQLLWMGWNHRINTLKAELAGNSHRAIQQPIYSAKPKPQDRRQARGGQRR